MKLKKFIETSNINDKIEIHTIIKEDGVNLKNINKYITEIKSGLIEFHKLFKEIDDTFDRSIYGQTHAKTQLKK